MSSWNPTQYLTFSEWRTRPSLDLVQRIAVPSPGRIVDLGCGPGNSTAVCRERWPTASSRSAISSILVTLFQFLPVPEVFSVLSIVAIGSFVRPIP